MSFLKKFGSIFTGIVAGFLFGPGAFSLSAFSIGNIVGGLLFNRPQTAQSAFGDLQQPKSEYKSFIPILHGSVKVGGQFIDADPKGALLNFTEEKQHNRPSRNFSGAVLWCEAMDGPKEILKIWGNEILILDTTAATDAARGYVMTTDGDTGVSFGWNKAYGQSGTGGSDFNNRLLWNYPGNHKQPPNPYLEYVHGAGLVPAYRPCCYSVFRHLNLDPFDLALPALKALVRDGVTGKVELIEAWAVRGGVPSEALELSFIEGEVLGQFMSSQGAPKDKIEELANFSFCDIVEVDGLIKDSDRKNPVVHVITEDELGAYDFHAQNSQPGPTLAIEVGQSEDVPSECSAGFIDSENDYETGAANALGVPGQSKNPKSFDMSIVSTLDEMTQWVQPALDEAIAAKDSYKLSLLPGRLDIGPGDALDISTPTGRRLIRVVEQTAGTLGPIDFSCLSFDPDVYTGHRTTISPVKPPSVVPQFGDPIGFIADTVALDGAMRESAGVLLAASQTADYEWHGAHWHGQIIVGGSSTVTDEFECALPARAVMGQTLGIVPLGDVYRYDTGRSLTFSMLWGALRTADAALVRAGNANVLVFETGRVLSFLTSADNGDGTMTISGIKDGRWGSDFDGDILAGTRFVLLYDEAGARSGGVVWQPLPAKSESALFKSAFLDRDAAYDLTYAQLVDLDANSLKPPSPVAVRLVRPASGTYAGGAVLTGRARTRVREDGAWNSPGPGTSLDDLEFQIALGNGTITVMQDLTATDAAFTFSWTTADLLALFGGAPVTLSGSIAQIASSFGPTYSTYNPKRFGHARSFAQE